MLQLQSSIPEYYGFSVVDHLFDAHSLEALRTEAYSQMANASEHCVMEDRANDWRGGTPARRFKSAPGGAVQTAFFRSPSMISFLHQWSGLDLEPSGERGSYSYYTRPGDHLSIHRDVDSCEIVVITCLHSAGNTDSYAGALCLYPKQRQALISTIRATPHLNALAMHLSLGQSIVMRGGIIPHALFPLGMGQFRIVSILCYRLGQTGKPA